MPATLEWHLTGGASNADPDASLGGVHSSEIISGTALNNLFDDVSVSEASAGDTEYRALDLYNSGDESATGVVIYMSTETSSSDTSLDFGISDTDEIDDTTSVADESTPPSAHTFGHYLTGSRLSLAEIPAGSYARVWFKRIVDASAVNTSNDNGTFTVEYA
jgi:hypothetical protein